LARDGDTVTIDLETQRCDLEVDEEEMAKRRAAWTPSKPQFDSGWLQIYRRNVGPLTKGAVLVDPQ
jgi:dihydroxy-acid dehydratase